MAKNESDFDFEKEYGFDPNSFLNDLGSDEDIDLSEFDDELLGLAPESSPKEKESEKFDDDLDLDGLDLGGDFDADADLDLDGLDLGGDSDLDADLDLDAFLNSDDDAAPDMGEDADFQSDLDLRGDDALFEEEVLSDADDFPADDELPEDPDLFADEDLSDDLDFSLEDDFGDEPDFPEDIEPEEIAMDETMEYPQQMEQSAQTEFLDDPVLDEEAQDEPTPREPKPPRRKERKPREPREPREPKEAKPNILTKFFDLYFAPVLNKELQEPTVDPNNPRRRRRKSKVQIFKEVYLPPIIACVCLILILSFVIGAISNAIEQKKQNDIQKENDVQASISAAAQAEQEYQRVMAEAAELAASYDYQGAIDKLDTFPDINSYPDMGAKRAEYINIRDSMVEYKDFSQIPNLSFHVLINDPARAYADPELGGKYNLNFVTTEEFSKILQQLYANNYVLVDFDSFVEVGITVSGTEQYIPKSIFLPEGKKPFMLTETMVNYFEYMVDSNNDGVADAGGDGFANKLVLDASGNIKAEYVDASGSTLTGNYDLVPILEDFIAQHPDFSYKGSRAILAVTGNQGIFGYRCNTSYVQTKGNDYYEQEKAGAIEIVNALRNKGYTLACYTYANDAYGNFNSANITADLQSWTQQIKPIIGDIDTFVFAQMSDLTDYTGTSFNVMYQTGFRYFISNGKSPSTAVNNTYVKQDRLMVTGETMAWYSDRFTGMFDCNMVLDMTSRGSVPKT